MGRKAKYSHVFQLTDREIEALKYAALPTNKDSAAKMGVTHLTFATYLNKCYQKMNVNSKTQAIVKGLTQGIIKLEDLYND